MKFEVVESTGQWIVRHCDEEVARFDQQASALDEVSRRMRGAKSGEAASLAVRFEPRRSA